MSSDDALRERFNWLFGFYPRVPTDSRDKSSMKLRVLQKMAEYSDARSAAERQLSAAMRAGFAEVGDGTVHSAKFQAASQKMCEAASVAAEFGLW